MGQCSRGKAVKPLMYIVWRTSLMVEMASLAAMFGAESRLAG